MQTFQQVSNVTEKVSHRETGRNAFITRKEHDKDMRNIDMKSAIAEHSHNLNRRINFKKFCIIRREKNW